MTAHLTRLFLLLPLCVALSLFNGCAIVSVASTAVSVVGTAVDVGVAVGSTAVSVVSTVGKGAVNAVTSK
jgi:hypothetical protein